MRDIRTKLEAAVAVLLCATIPLFGTPNNIHIADAAKTGDIETIRALIAEAVDVSSAQGDGMTALHWAALNGDAQIAQLLIYAGANVRATTRLGGYTPLLMGAKSGSDSIIDLLLKRSVDPNTTAVGGVTPLMMAASSGQSEAVRILLEANADVDAAEYERGQTALAYAAAFNHPKAIDLLLRHGADADKKGALRKPAVRPSRNPQRQQRNPTAAGGNPRGGLTALMYASREGHTEAVIALIRGGAKLNEISADHSTALLIATLNGKFDVAKVLIENGADVSIASMDGATPLFGIANIQWAPKTDTPQPSVKYEKVHYLDLMLLSLESGADPNVRTKKELWYTRNREGTSSAGVTPFWRCASVGDISCMRLLIAYGADPEIANTDGITPLLIAAGAGFHGNNELTTPNGRLSTVKYLVGQLQADVNKTDTAESKTRNNTMNTSRFAGGFAAVHHAAARGDNEMIVYLVSKGANVDVTSLNGTTVVDMANGPRQRIQPYPDTVALLEILGSRNSYRCISC